MSAIANETINRLPIRRRDLSVATAMHTRAFPTIEMIIIKDKSVPETNTNKESSLQSLNIA